VRIIYYQNVSDVLKELKMTLATSMTSARFSEFSDFHKDAYGFRPGAPYMRALERMSEGELEAEWQRIAAAADYAAEVEKAAGAAAIARFEELLSDIETTVIGSTRRDAIRISLESYDVDMECPQSIEHAFWKMGLPFDYIDSLIRKEIFPGWKPW
jgi:threonine synthase